MKRLAGLSLALALAACGGGGGGGGGGGSSGGGNLTVSFSYANSTLNLWSPITLQADIAGLQGNTPQCTITAGALPPGMSLSGCNITGTPSQTGTHSATVRLTANGYNGSVSANANLTVAAPTVVGTDNFLSTWPWGSAGTPRSIVRVGNVDPGLADTISYQVSSGALPLGLALSSAGVLSGETTELNPQPFFITATLQRGAQQVTTAPAQVSVNVTPPVLSYPGCCAQSWTQAVSFDPSSTYAGAGTSSYTTSSTLPAGFSLDPVSGRVSLSGLVELPGLTLLTLTQHITHTNGGTTSASTELRFNPTRYPTAQYASIGSTLTLNQPFVLAAPSFINREPGDAASFALRARANATVPAWLNINPVTGEVWGTPTGTNGDRLDVYIEVTHSRNGLTRLQEQTMSVGLTL